MQHSYRNDEEQVMFVAGDEDPSLAGRTPKPKQKPFLSRMCSPTMQRAVLLIVTLYLILVSVFAFISWSNVDFLLERTQSLDDRVDSVITFSRIRRFCVYMTGTNVRNAIVIDPTSTAWGSILFSYNAGTVKWNITYQLGYLNPTDVPTALTIFGPLTTLHPNSTSTVLADFTMPSSPAHTGTLIGTTILSPPAILGFFQNPAAYYIQLSSNVFPDGSSSDIMSNLCAPPDTFKQG